MVGVKDFLLNASILISIIYISSFIHKHLMTSMNIKIKQTLFVLASIFAGCVAMMFGIRLSDSVLFDLRFIPLILCILFSKKSYHSIIVGTAIGLFRLVFGVSDAAIAGLVNMIILGFIGVILSLLLQKVSFIKRLIIIVVFINVFNIINIAVFGVLEPDFYFQRIVPIATPISVLFSILLALIIRDLQYEYKQKVNLLNKALKDPLTQVYNSRVLKQTLREIKGKLHYQSYPVSLAFIDIDDFKLINDQYGHLMGDLVLKKVSDQLSKSILNDGKVIRYGGDEFVIIMEERNSSQMLEKLNEIQIYFNTNDFIINNHSIKVSISIGIASYPNIDLENLLKAADQNAYKAKNNGKNQIITT